MVRQEMNRCSSQAVSLEGKRQQAGWVEHVARAEQSKRLLNLWPRHSQKPALKQWLGRIPL